MTPVKENLARITEAIVSAAAKSGRKPEDISIVAVTKTATVERIAEARDAGVLLFGENRVQDAAVKVPAFPQSVWHMIGHLQTNKIKDALSLFQVIQSVDSVRLAQKIAEESALLGKNTPIFLEVNISGQEQRYGLAPEELYAAADVLAKLEHVTVTGLMGIAPFPATDDEKRASFRKLKGLFGVCKAFKYPNFQMKHLSMGMSDDYALAVEEGSNMLRLGRAIFA